MEVDLHDQFFWDKIFPHHKTIKTLINQFKELCNKKEIDNNYIQLFFNDLQFFIQEVFFYYKIIHIYI